MISIRDHNIKGFLYAAASSVFVSLGFVITKIILKEVNSETSSVFFIGFGTLTSFLVLGVKKDLKKLKLFKAYWQPLTVLGFLGGASSLTWFYAIDLIGPSLTSFLIRFVIILTALLGIVFLKEKFNRVEVLGMVVAVGGVFLITYMSNNGGQFLILGVSMALMSAFFFSVMQLIVKLYAGRISPFMVNHFRLMLTLPILLVYALVTQKLQLPSYPTLILAFVGGVLTGVIGVTLFYKALELAELSKVNVIRTMDPFIVVLCAFLFLKEVPAPIQLLGGLVIVSGVLILTISRYRPKIIARWIP